MRLIRGAACALLIASLAGCALGQSPDTVAAEPDDKVEKIEATPEPMPLATSLDPEPSTAPPADLAASDDLFCRDLNGMGYTYAESVAYWLAHGRPSRMDADGNGIPCETVYSRADVESFYGSVGPAEQSRPPEGTLHILGPGHGARYGQGFSRLRNCSTWTLRFVNDSDTAIRSVDFAPASAAYSGTSAESGTWVEIPAESSREVVVVSLQPGAARDVTFETCTTTPPPSDHNLTFGARTPDSIAFSWVTGVSGTTRIM